MKSLDCLIVAGRQEGKEMDRLRHRNEEEYSKEEEKLTKMFC